MNGQVTVFLFRTNIIKEKQLIFGETVLFFKRRNYRTLKMEKGLATIVELFAKVYEH